MAISYVRNQIAAVALLSRNDKLDSLIPLFSAIYSLLNSRAKVFGCVGAVFPEAEASGKTANRALHERALFVRSTMDILAGCFGFR